jgi:hypothetical protein
MKKQLFFGLTMLVLAISACGGQVTQTQPAEPAVPVETVTQPAPPTFAPSSTATDTTVPATDTALPATEALTSSVSFANDVLPILNSSCNECHGGRQVKEGLDVGTYESLMAGSFNGPVIVAGNSADSLLVQQVINGKMPKRGAKLTPGQIKTISDWVNAGALNN